MRFRVLSILFLLAAALSVRADDKLPLLKAGADVYSNVTVTAVSATDVYFTHSGGMGNAKLKDLDPELQKHFNYNPVQADVAAKKQAAANSEFRQQIISAPVPVPRDETRVPPTLTPQGDIVVPQIYAHPFLHKHAPDCVVDKWLTDAPDTKGKFILMNFFEMRSEPCRRAIPDLNEIQAEFKDHLVVVGLSDESEDAFRKITDPKIDYSVAVDPQRRMLLAVGVTAIPHLMLMDPHGIVRFEGTPFYLDRQWLGRVLGKYIQNELKTPHEKYSRIQSYSQLDLCARNGFNPSR